MKELICKNCGHSETLEKINGSNVTKILIAPYPRERKKDGLPEKAREIMRPLQVDFNCQFEEKDSIGKRYRRQDAIGTPYCITVDHQTLEDNTVTFRDRDSMNQERIPVEKLHSFIAEKVNIAKYLG